MKNSPMNPYFPAGAAPVRLYRNPRSGHCHRGQLMLSLPGVPCEPVDPAKANGAHKAPEGGVGVETCPAIRAWLDRIAALPGLVGMARSPIPTDA